MLGLTFYVLLFHMLDILKQWKKITGFDMTDCLSLPGPGWKYFNSLGTEEDEPI